MENILFIELTSSEQEALQGGVLLGSGEGESTLPPVLNSVQLEPVVNTVKGLLPSLPA